MDNITNIYPPRIIERFEKQASIDGAFSMYFQKRKQQGEHNELLIISEYAHILVKFCKEDWMEFDRYFNENDVLGDSDRHKEAVTYKIDFTKDYTLVIETVDMNIADFMLYNNKRDVLDMVEGIRKKDRPDCANNTEERWNYSVS